MASGKFKEISDDMIGMDERVCSCASKVIDMIITEDGHSRGRGAHKKVKRAARKQKGTEKVRSK